MAKKKEKSRRQEPPVVTGRDRRGPEREKGSSPFEGESDAPDGVTGNWS